MVYMKLNMTYGRITYLVFPSAFWPSGALQENQCRVVSLSMHNSKVFYQGKSKCFKFLHTNKYIEGIKFLRKYLVIMQDATSRPNFALGSNENLPFINRKLVNFTNNFRKQRPADYLFFNTTSA